MRSKQLLHTSNCEQGSVMKTFCEVTKRDTGDYAYDCRTMMIYTYIHTYIYIEEPGKAIDAMA